MKRDYLKWGALLFALVATASAEYELARAVGFNQWVAAAVPGALDIYTVRAMRAHRDVLAAVTAMIGVNAASHLVTAGLLPINVPLVVAVSAIAPLVLWRVHSLRESTDPVPEPEPVEAPAVPAPAVVERVDLEDVPAPEVRPELPPVPGAAVLAVEKKPRTRVSAPVPDATDDELIARTRVDFAGQIPTYSALKSKYGIGQVRARRIRDVLESELPS
ncbi:hypothetical protein [Actinacidiphila glaucinigra]|uniref:hypothetical protein n=1 Tax=Actinacidiphila glaucinigra TaxID=235986 RepID=UPI0037175696